MILGGSRLLKSIKGNALSKNIKIPLAITEIIA